MCSEAVNTFSVFEPPPAPSSRRKAISGQHQPHCPTHLGPLLGLYSPKDPEKKAGPLQTRTPKLRAGTDLLKLTQLVGSSSRTRTRLSSLRSAQVLPTRRGSVSSFARHTVTILGSRLTEMRYNPPAKHTHWQSEVQVP